MQWWWIRSSPTRPWWAFPPASWRTNAIRRATAPPRLRNSDARQDKLEEIQMETKLDRTELVQTQLDLTVIIPSYNTRRLLGDCLASIYQHTYGVSCEVICIDDNSADGSAEMVAEAFPEVILIRNTVNQGYVNNTNLGMRMSRARYACHLNSDTRLI